MRQREGGREEEKKGDEKEERKGRGQEGSEGTSRKHYQFCSLVNSKVIHQLPFLSLPFDFHFSPFRFILTHCLKQCLNIMIHFSCLFNLSQCLSILHIPCHHQQK